jgi:hypothetical protein
MSRAVMWACLPALAILFGCQGEGPLQRTAVDAPVVFRFATVGDSRQEPGRPGNTAQDEIWLQSTAVFARILHEMERHKPQALIFNGDMIYGYRTDLAAVDREYAFWRGMVAGTMERGTYVLPVPGNHETQWPVPNSRGGTSKASVNVKEDAWRRNMGDLIVNLALWSRLTGFPVSAWSADNAPAKGSDGVTTDQRQLSYSFDSGPIHLAVINTDPVGFDASAPVNWLKGDLAAARARGARHFFVFGHKMAYTYHPEGSKKGKPDGFDFRPDVRDAFWDAIEEFGAVYFCGHEHVYHASQPRAAAGGKAWQVIVGSGGSPLSVRRGESANRNDGMFAWAEVTVHQDGKVKMRVLGFDQELGATRELEVVQF